MIKLIMLLGKSIAGILIFSISVATGTSEPNTSRFLMERWHQDLVSKTCQQPSDKISFYLKASRGLASETTFVTFEEKMTSLLKTKSTSSKSLDILKLLEFKRDEVKYNYHHDLGGILRDVLYFEFWIRDYLSGVMGLSTKRRATPAERALSRQLVQQSAFLAQLDLKDVLNGSEEAPYQPSLQTMPKGHFRFLNAQHKEAQKLFSTELSPTNPLAKIQADWKACGKKKFEDRKAALKSYATYLKKKKVGMSLTSPFIPPSGRGALSMSIIDNDYIVAAYARENGETYKYLHLVITDFCTGVFFSEKAVLKAGTTISLVSGNPLVYRIDPTSRLSPIESGLSVNLTLTMEEYLEPSHKKIIELLDSIFARAPDKKEIPKNPSHLPALPKTLQQQSPPKAPADAPSTSSDRSRKKMGASKKKIPGYPPPSPPLKQPENPKTEADPRDGSTPSPRKESSPPRVRSSQVVLPSQDPPSSSLPPGALPIQTFIQQPPFHPQYQPWRTSPQSLGRPPAFVPGSYPESFPPSAPPLDSPASSLYPKLDPQVVPTKPLPPVPPPKPKHLVGGVALPGMGPSPETGKK